MEYSNLILDCYDMLSKTYIEIGKLNQEIKNNPNSSRMIKIHGYSSARVLMSYIAKSDIEMSSAIETTYQQWVNAQKISTSILTEKMLVLEPLVHWKNNETAQKYYLEHENTNLLNIFNSLADYKDSLIKGAIFYAKILIEQPLETISNVYAENHLAAILSNVIDMPLYPLRSSKPQELKNAITEYKKGNTSSWINYFLNLIILQIKNNLMLLSDINDYLNNLKYRMNEAGVSHLKIDIFCDILIDNSFVDAKLVSQKANIVPYRAKLALDLMAEKGILLKSDTKRNTTYILIDYYRKFLNR